MLRLHSLVVIAPLLLAACSKPEATIGADAGTYAAPPAVTASSPKPMDPDTLKVTGKLRYQPSFSYMPGSKDPSGKTSGSFEVFIEDLAIDAAPGAKALRDVVRFDDSPMKMSSPNPGTCKTTLTTNNTADLIGVNLEEPGCNTLKLSSERSLKSAFIGSAKGKLVASGKPVDVQFDVKPGDAPFGAKPPAKKE